MPAIHRIKCAVVLATTILAFGSSSLTQVARSGDTVDNSSPSPKQQTVDLFDGMKSGQLAVRFIPHDAAQGQILVTNKTDQPLTVKLPDAFAAVPVLAQAAGAAGGAARQPRQNNNQNQAVGGGGLGGGGGGLGGGAFDVAPEKTAKIKVATVCLEHGKKEPSAHVPYEIEPIDAYTNDANVQSLCKLLGTGDISQRTAQAAAWHFANGMTWEELADKKIHHLIGGDEQYFSTDEILTAIKVADRAMKLADAHPASPSSTQPSSAQPATSTPDQK